MGLFFGILAGLAFQEALISEEKHMQQTAEHSFLQHHVFHLWDFPRFGTVFVVCFVISNLNRSVKRGGERITSDRKLLNARNAQVRGTYSPGKHWTDRFIGDWSLQATGEWLVGGYYPAKHQLFE